MNFVKFAGSFHLSIFLLTLITAVAHLYLGMQSGDQLQTLFLLNGLGYLGLVVIFLLPQVKSWHGIIRLMLLGYTLLTLFLWFIITSPWKGDLDPFDLTVKAVEVVLVIHLLLDRLQENSLAK